MMLPEGFPEDLVEQVLGPYPDGKPGEMRLAGDAWSDSAERCRVLAGRCETVSAVLRQSGEGHTYAEASRRYADLARDLSMQADYHDSMAEQQYTGANSIELGQLNWIGIGTVMVIQLVASAYLLYAAPVKMAADRVVAQAAWRIVLRSVVETITLSGARATASRGAMVLASTVLGAVTGAGVMAAAQGWQWAQGNRKTFDWKSIAIAGISGAAGGAAGAGAAAGLAGRLGLHTGITAPAGRWATAGNMLLLGGVGGIAGAGAGLGAAAVAPVLFGDGVAMPTLEDLHVGIVTGLVGGVVGSAVHAVHTAHAAPLAPMAAQAEAGLPDTPSVKPETTGGGGEPPESVSVDLVRSDGPDHGDLAPSAASDDTTAPLPDEVGIEPEAPAVTGPEVPFPEQAARIQEATTRLSELDAAVESAMFDANVAEMAATDAASQARLRTLAWLDAKLESLELRIYSDADAEFAAENLLNDMWDRVGDAYDRANTAYQDSAGAWAAVRDTIEERNNHKIQVLDDFTRFVGDALNGASSKPSWMAALAEAHTVESVIGAKERAYATERVAAAQQHAADVSAERARDILIRTVLEERDRLAPSDAPDDEPFGRIAAALADETRIDHEVRDFEAQMQAQEARNMARAALDDQVDQHRAMSRAAEKMSDIMDELLAHAWPSELSAAAVGLTNFYLRSTRANIPDLHAAPRAATLTSVLSERFPGVADIAREQTLPDRQSTVAPNRSPADADRVPGAPRTRSEEAGSVVDSPGAGASDRLDPTSAEANTGPASRPQPDLSNLPPVRELFDTPDNQTLTARLQGLGQQYGPYRLGEVVGKHMNVAGEPDIRAAIRVEADILDEDTKIGYVRQIIAIDGDDRFVVDVAALNIENANARGRGFSSMFLNAVEDYYRSSGVDRVQVRTGAEKGAVFWARAGYDWNPNPVRLAQGVEQIRERLSSLRETASPADRYILDGLLARFAEPVTVGETVTEYPSPLELVSVVGDDPRLGVRIMEWMDLWLMKKL
ncbi:hypothetical protein [Nocardia brevicatena]|uniref:hypothetical protein n=1 Tax=Nocardia brevicatena TaxID=37327 RepID=UPI0002DEC333|nr:hypothetical protein [Nocardia brevicatena]